MKKKLMCERCGIRPREIKYCKDCKDELEQAKGVDFCECEGILNYDGEDEQRYPKFKCEECGKIFYNDIWFIFYNDIWFNQKTQVTNHNSQI